MGRFIKNLILYIFKRRIYTFREVAGILNCSTSDICQLMYAKKLKMIKDWENGSWDFKIKQKDLEVYISNIKERHNA